ncbi:MAG: hypothetical protein H6737_10260 [Alphaproteobacteria bacterium]|nr:hypothetical protein [Alphaproteobacteria bacterium]
MKLAVDPHPLLEIAAFVSVFPRPLGSGWPTLTLSALLDVAPPPLEPADAKTPVRDMLRHGGFKPAGRSKPASEYVQNAIPEGRLGDINAAVDACNAASFRSGLPISVVDLDRTVGDLRVGLAPAGARYVFNASGQEIDIGGLVVLFDAEGPCANAVKDSQRTKTHDGTVRTLSILWGATALPGRAALAADWYAGVLSEAGVAVERI